MMKCWSPRAVEHVSEDALKRSAAEFRAVLRIIDRHAALSGDGAPIRPPPKDGAPEKDGAAHGSVVRHALMIIENELERRHARRPSLHSRNP